MTLLPLRPSLPPSPRKLRALCLLNRLHRQRDA
jgi:hypothetical protein